jgi:hypothetical protein
MRVTMLAKITGTRDGIEWPTPGYDIELPDDEAASLVHNGLAKPAVVPVESAAVAPVENATAPQARKR